jgi:hypothetical protein
MELDVEAIINNIYISDVIDDGVKTISALTISNSLDKELTDEEYNLFLIEQARQKHLYRFIFVNQEIINYVSDMIQARTLFYAHLGYDKSPKLIELDNKKLLYY